MQASILSEFRSAYEIGKSKNAELFKGNPLVEVVEAFETDKRVLALDEDIPIAISGMLKGTLIDYQKLNEGADKLEELASHILNHAKKCREKATKCLEERQAAGVTEEDFLKIVPIEKKSNRKANLELLKSDAYKKKYDLLLENAKDELEESFTPTIKAIEVMFGKKADEVLIPGSVQIVGYKVEPISPMPEKASVGVEP